MHRRGVSFPAHDRIDAAIAIGRKFPNDRLNRGDELATGLGEDDPVECRAPPLARSATLDLTAPIVSYSVFIANRPSATAATATSVF